MKKTTTFLILFLAPFFLKAQFVTDYKVLGDKAFANKEYYAAAIYYQKVIHGEQNGNESKPYQAHHRRDKKSKTYNKVYLYYHLAESFRLYENYVNAETWYYKVLEEPEAAEYPLGRLWLGVCLRANQRFEESVKQLERYLATNHTEKKYDELAKKEIANCVFAQKQYQHPKAFTVTKMKGNWNSDGSNYSLSKRGNNAFWLTSSRYTSLDSHKKAKPHLNRIFFAAKNSTGSPDLKEIDFDNSFSKEAEWGTPVFDPSGKHMYFTHWFKEGNKMLHAIYSSRKEDNNEWSSPQKLNVNINVEGFDAIQPFVTKDAKHLYFASNKPGGQGGYDLWVSELDEQGNPHSSVNLGRTINTTMDEQAPYYNNADKKLIYSSKGFTGLGGFDFMESFGEPGKWTKPENMGYPMNSAKDDLYYAVDLEEPDLAYISSDRQSECCLELYTVKNSMPKSKIFLVSGFVTDCDQLKPLANAKVSLVDSVSKQEVKQVLADSSGKYQFEVKDKKSYQLTVEKEGYFTKKVQLFSFQENTDTLKNPYICLKPFVVGKAIVLKNIFFDYNKANIRLDSKVELDVLVTIMKDNPNIRIELSAHTDAIGGKSYNQKLSQARAQSCVDYLIQAGILEERIVAKGYGETRPVAPNLLANGRDNPEGRQMNRRTEFTVL